MKLGNFLRNSFKQLTKTWGKVKRVKWSSLPSISLHLPSKILHFPSLHFSFAPPLHLYRRGVFWLHSCLWLNQYHPSSLRVEEGKEQSHLLWLIFPSFLLDSKYYADLVLLPIRSDSNSRHPMNMIVRADISCNNLLSSVLKDDHFVALRKKGLLLHVKYHTSDFSELIGLLLIWLELFVFAIFKTRCEAIAKILLIKSQPNVIFNFPFSNQWIVVSLTLIATVLKSTVRYITKWRFYSSALN